MIQIIQIFILGLALGGVYALMSSGMTLIFGVMRIVNLAHSAFIVMAAYLAFWLFKAFNLDPILSMVITMPVMFLVGMVYYRVLFASRADNPRFTDITVLITFATGLVIEGVLAFIFTGIYRSTTPELCQNLIQFWTIFYSSKSAICLDYQHCFDRWVMDVSYVTPALEMPSGQPCKTEMPPRLLA